MSFSAHAQFPTSFTFSNDFNGAVPAGMTLTGPATVNGGYLKLTTQFPGGQLGTAFLDGLPAVQGVQSFRATFRAALFGGTVPPADGFSFSLAPAAFVPIGAGPGEEGTATGLTISFDTYDNGGEPPSISVRWNGSLMGEQLVQVSTSPGGITDPASRLRDFSIQLDPDGTIDIVHNGVVIFNNLPTLYEPIYGGRWVLSARTGGLADNHWFDDLNISATLTPAPAALTNGSCLNFDGGYVEVPHAADLNTLPFTVAARIRVTGPQSSQTILSKRGPQGSGLELSVSNGLLFATYVPGAGAGAVINAGFVADAQWHHVALTGNTNDCKLYLDGYLMQGAPLFSPAPSTAPVPLRIGVSAVGASPFFGQIDDVSWWNVELNSAAIATDRMRSPLGNEPSLVAYWSFNEGIGDVAGDVTGRGHNGALKSVVGWMPQPPPAPRLAVGSQLDLEGGWITVPHTAALNAYPLTIQAWVRTTNVEPSPTAIVNKYSDGSANGYSLHVVNGNLFGWYFRNSNNRVPSSGGVPGGFIADGQWHHVAFTVNEFAGEVVVDGVSRGREGWIGPPGPTTTFQPLSIGRYVPSGVFRGQMDEVSVWNVALSQSAIQARMNIPLAGDEPGLLAYYRFNEAGGSTVRDSSTNANHGSVGGEAFWDLESTPLRILDGRSALSFNGGFVEVPHHTNFNVMPISLSAWIRTTNANTRILYKRIGSSDVDNGYELSIQNGVLWAGYALNDFTFFFPAHGIAVNDGKWHHVAFTLEDNGGLLYVDGARTFGSTWAFDSRPTSSPEPLRIGSASFRGEIDEVAIWNLRLSAFPVQQPLTNPTVASVWNRRLDGNEPGLVALYHFDESSGTNVVDATGHGNTGRWTNGVTRVASGARLQDTSSIRGRITAGLNAVTNTQVLALFGPQTGPGLLPIPDNGTIESTNFIPASGIIGLTKVSVNIRHTFRGDLELTLIHPDGTAVRLKDANVNDDGADWVAFYPDDTVPAANLAVLNGKSMSGAWRLRVRDAFAEDVGVLNTWTLALGTAPVFTDSTGDYAFSNLFNATFTVQPQRDGFVFSPASRTVPSASVGVNFDVVSAFIAGRVIDGVTGLAGVTISAFGASGTTDSSGNYRLAPLPPGNYSLAPTSTGYGFAPTQRAAALGDSNANFSVVSLPVSGRVVDLMTNGVAGVTVSAGAQSAVTDIDGNYFIAQVPPGARTITPSRGAAIFVPANRSVTVGPALTGVNFTLQSGPPTITALHDKVIAKDSSTGPMRFDVDDRETRAGLLTLAATSSDTSIVPVGNITFDGVGNARTVTVTPRAGVSGVVTLTVRVTDESGLSSSQSFTLRVNAPPLPGVGGALNFDGTNDFVGITRSVLGNKGNFTVEFWANAPANSGARALFQQGAGTNVFSLALDAAGNLRVSDVWNTGVPFPFGAWHHIALVKETANARLYIDGVLRASRGSTIPLPGGATNTFVGQDLSGTPRWRGILDEVRFWGLARTAEQIATNRNSRLVGYESELLGLWRFDERNGTTAIDVSSNAFQGVLTGLPDRVQSGVLFSHYVTTEDTPIRDVLQAFDPDNDVLTFNLVTPPQRGTVTLNDPHTGAFTYTPNANASGEDRFTFNVSDGFADSDISLLTITITPDTNAPSISFVGNQTMAEDTTLGPLAFTVTDLEVAASNLTMSGVCSVPSLVPAEGFAFGGSGSNRTVTLRPATNANGPATISLIVSDGKLTATNSFTLNVTAVNDPPTISALTNQLTRRGAPVAQAFVISDVDSTANDFTAVSGIGGGDVLAIAGLNVNGTGANRTSFVTAAANQSGAASIVVTVGDGQEIVQAIYTVRVDEPPSIAAITNQTTFAGKPTKPIAVTISDVDSDVATVTVGAISSNPLLVAPEGFAFSGSGSSRTLVVTPLPGQVGSATITVMASDSLFVGSNSFTLFVEQPFEYTFADLPTLPGHLSGQAESINDAGVAAGRSQPDEDDTGGFGLRRAVVWDTSVSVPTVASVPTLESAPSWALAINNAGQVVGTRYGPSASAPNTGGSRGWVFRNGTVTDLAFTLGTFNRGESHDINDNGIVVGTTNYLVGQAFVFDGTAATNITRFRFDFDMDNIELTINNAGDLVGVATNAGARRTLLIQADGTVRDLFTRLGGTENYPSDINNAGQILGDVRIPTGVQKFPYIYNYRTDTLNTNIHTALAGIGLVQDYDTHEINDSGEAVGGAEDAAGTQFAWLYSDGRAYNLQDVVSPSVFRPKVARGINNAGDIVGVGRRPGDANDRPFVLRRQWLVGQPLPPPVAAINPATQRAYQPPRVEAIDGTPTDQAATATLWSDLEQKLYFVRPMAARVTWLTTADLANPNPTPPVVRVGRAVFPADAQVHVAGAPVQVEPLSASSPYRAVAMRYTTVPGAVFDQGTKSLTANQPGYTVIHYLIAPEAVLGSTPDLLTHSNYFQVVRSVAWNDPLVFRDAQPAVVGPSLTTPSISLLVSGKLEHRSTSGRCLTHRRRIERSWSSQRTTSSLARRIRQRS